MHLWSQIAYGTFFLSLCAALQLMLIVLSLPLLTRITETINAELHMRRASILVTLAFALTVIVHTAHVWIWAGAFLWQGAFQDVATAVYFALTSYTTLGYGDITLGESMRIFGAFASVCGMLAFGVSTAYLVGMITRVLPKSLQ